MPDVQKFTELHEEQSSWAGDTQEDSSTHHLPQILTHWVQISEFLSRSFNAEARYQHPRFFESLRVSLNPNGVVRGDPSIDWYGMSASSTPSGADEINQANYDIYELFKSRFVYQLAAAGDNPTTSRITELTIWVDEHNFHVKTIPDLKEVLEGLSTSQGSQDV